MHAILANSEIPETDTIKLLIDKGLSLLDKNIHNETPIDVFIKNSAIPENERFSFLRSLKLRIHDKNEEANKIEEAINKLKVSTKDFILKPRTSATPIASTGDPKTIDKNTERIKNINDAIDYVNDGDKGLNKLKKLAAEDPASLFQKISGKKSAFETACDRNWEEDTWSYFPTFSRVLISCILNGKEIPEIENIVKKFLEILEDTRIPLENKCDIIEDLNTENLKYKVNKLTATKITSKEPIIKFAKLLNGNDAFELTNIIKKGKNSLDFFNNYPEVMEKEKLSLKFYKCLFDNGYLNKSNLNTVNASGKKPLDYILSAIQKNMKELNIENITEIENVKDDSFEPLKNELKELIELAAKLHIQEGAIVSDKIKNSFNNILGDYIEKEKIKEVNGRSESIRRNSSRSS